MTVEEIRDLAYSGKLKLTHGDQCLEIIGTLLWEIDMLRTQNDSFRWLAHRWAVASFDIHETLMTDYSNPTNSTRRD